LKLFFCATYIFFDPFHHFYSKCIFCFLLLLFCLFAVIRKRKYLFYFILEAGRIIPLKVVFAELIKMFGRATFKLVFDSRHLADSKEKGEFGKRSKRDEKKPASHADNA